MPLDLGRTDPISVADDGQSVVMRCNGCHAEERLAYTPTGDLLSGMERFIKTHGDCQP